MVSTTPATAYTITRATYTVPGSKGNVYVVSVDPSTGVMECSCPDSTCRRRQCKHQRAVIAGEAGKVRVAIRPKPVAACALCGTVRTDTIDAANFAGLPDGARICAPWVHCTG